MAGERTYTPPPLQLLAAATAGRNLNRLVGSPAQLEVLGALSEDLLLLLFAAVCAHGGLTVRVAMAFEQLAVEGGHTELARRVGRLDVAAAMLNSAAAPGTCSPRREIG
jgi:hypothetical protein